MVNTDSCIEEEIEERTAARNRANHAHKIGHVMFTKTWHTVLTK